MTDAAPSWPAPPNHERVVVLEPLTGELVDFDTTAYLASPDAITAHSAGRWPINAFTRKENLVLIAQHEAEHNAGEAFAYAILDVSRQRELGCTYLRPLDPYLSRTGTVLEGVAAGSAVVTFWVVDDAASRPSATAVLDDILAWSAAWGVAPVVVRALPDERESLAAIVELGLDEIPARHQQLPYRWFQG